MEYWVGLFGNLAVVTTERFVEGEHTGEMGGEATSDGIVRWTGEVVQLIGLAGEGKDGDPADLTGVEVNIIAGVDMVDMEGKTADEVEDGYVVETIGVEGKTKVGVELIGVELMGVDDNTVHGVKLFDLEDGGKDGVVFTDRDGHEVTVGWENSTGVELMKVELLGVELRGVLCLVLRASMTVAERCQ